MVRLPKFYDWGGGGIPYSWSFGWLTGEDGDLVCVLPNVKSKVLGEISLSPVCSNHLLALISFVCKLILLKVDKKVVSMCLVDEMRRQKEELMKEGYLAMAHEHAEFAQLAEELASEILPAWK